MEQDDVYTMQLKASIFRQYLLLYRWRMLNIRIHVPINKVFENNVEFFLSYNTNPIFVNIN